MPGPLIVKASAGEVVKIVLRWVGNYLLGKVKEEVQPSFPALRGRVQREEIKQALERAMVLFNEETIDQAVAILDAGGTLNVPPMWFRDP